MARTIEISKSFKFSASHRLPNHKGQCANWHGHTWKVTVTVSGVPEEKGPRCGMVMDYGYMEQILTIPLSLLDHSCLNDNIPNPTAENIALWLFNSFHEGFRYDIKLVSVTVEESDDTSATVRND